MNKRIPAFLLSACLALGGALSAASPVYAAPEDGDGAADAYISLAGNWHFRLYRTYSQMFQYFPYAEGGQNDYLKWEDLSLAALPSAPVFEEWESLPVPFEDYQTGGLLQNKRPKSMPFPYHLPAVQTPGSLIPAATPAQFPAAATTADIPAATPADIPLIADTSPDPSLLFPTWSEAWFCRTFTLPDNFTAEDTVTLLMGVIDDNDVVYINGTCVGSSGFVDDSGKNKVLDPGPLGGFDYKNPDADARVKWEKSYWEAEREYTFPASLLNQGQTNEIAIRVYNNNSNGGFYLGKTYALCGNELAVRAAKGLPAQIIDNPALRAVITAQIKALEAQDLETYAQYVDPGYHNDAADKAARIHELTALLNGCTDVRVEDRSPRCFADGGNFWYNAQRRITARPQHLSEPEVLFDDEINICYALVDGQFMEHGNWNRCYRTDYQSPLMGKTMTYSVYLPPSYYTDPSRTYPVVYLLHGQNSSSNSFLSVDHIGDFMDRLIANKTVTDMILIMPDSGKNAFYTDTAGGPNDNNGPWASHITEDIIPMADAAYRTKPEPAFRGISGISMGGGGAVTIGCRHPELFSSVASHMGYLPDSALDALRQFPQDILQDYDFYFDVGLQDQTVGIEGTKKAHEYLTGVHKNHSYSLRNGAHNSAFYMAGMPASMKMHSDHFLEHDSTYRLISAQVPEGLTLADSTADISAAGDETLTLRFDAPFSLLANVYLDGVILPENEFSAYAGSTIVSLPTTLLKKAGNGTHTVDVSFRNRKITSVQFTVASAPQKSGNSSSASQGSDAPSDTSPSAQRDDSASDSRSSSASRNQAFSSDSHHSAAAGQHVVSASVPADNAAHRAEHPGDIHVTAAVTGDSSPAGFFLSIVVFSGMLLGIYLRLRGKFC